VDLLSKSFGEAVELVKCASSHDQSVSSEIYKVVAAPVP